MQGCPATLAKKMKVVATKVLVRKTPFTKSSHNLAQSKMLTSLKMKKRKAILTIVRETHLVRILFNKDSRLQ